MNQINLIKNKTQILSILCLGYLLTGFTATATLQTTVNSLQPTPKTIYGTDNRTKPLNPQSYPWPNLQWRSLTLR
jgi:hypothetical protein